MIPPLIAALAAAAIAGAGCGGGADEDRAAVETSVRNYYVAFAADDGERACAELAEEAAKQLIEDTATKDCPAAIRKARQDQRVKRYLPDLAKVEVEAVRIEGERATADVAGIGATSSIPLVKEDDDWKIGGVGEPTE
jgi:hypothetical protein